jgi:heme/copper-type cytochrome/quinol oxidase subunit 2
MSVAVARASPGAHASSRGRKWMLCLAVAATLGCAALSIVAALRARAGATVLVRATAHQWWWEFAYPDLGIAARNELNVPSGEAVRIELASAHVMHTFWIPGMRAPEVVVPGAPRIVRLRFRPGTAVGTCDASCGCGSDCMSFRVRAPRERFVRWVARSRAAPTTRVRVTRAHSPLCMQPAGSARPLPETSPPAAVTTRPAALAESCGVGWLPGHPSGPDVIGRAGRAGASRD